MLSFKGYAIIAGVLIALGVGYYFSDAIRTFHWREMIGIDPEREARLKEQEGLIANLAKQNEQAKKDIAQAKKQAAEAKERSNRAMAMADAAEMREAEWQTKYDTLAKGKLPDVQRPEDALAKLKDMGWVR